MFRQREGIVLVANLHNRRFFVEYFYVQRAKLSTQKTSISAFGSCRSNSNLRNLVTPLLFKKHSRLSSHFRDLQSRFLFCMKLLLVNEKWRSFCLSFSPNSFVGKLSCMSSVSVSARFPHCLSVLQQVSPCFRLVSGTESLLIESDKLLQKVTLAYLFCSSSGEKPSFQREDRQTQPKTRSS